jgi:hypothetical protein
MADLPSIAEAIEKALAELDGPIPYEAFIARVLEIRPSKAKRPAQSIKNELRYGWQDRLIVSENTVMPTHIALQGVRFALPISRQEAERGVLLYSSIFQTHTRRNTHAETLVLQDADGSPLPVKPITRDVKYETIFGTSTIPEVAFDLAEWFKANHIQRDDFVLVTIIDWDRGHYRLVHEKHQLRRKRRNEIAARNQVLADAIFQQLEASRDGNRFAHEAILPALASLPDPQGYPGDPWEEVVQADPRMITDGISINYIKAPSPLQQALMDAMDWDMPEQPPKRISPQEARRVYRFRASLRHRKNLWREIEISGKATLAAFDVVLRDAFLHDTSDHLSSFTKLVARGKSRRSTKLELAVINPFDEGEGEDIQIAALELAPGDKLLYVYDFGDWIEHTIELQEITEPEADAKYPRIAGQNKPAYRYCQACAAEGRKVVAVYVCETCSEDRRPVYICEDHAVDLHNDHWTGELLY